MQATLNNLIEKAQAESKAKRYPGAETIVDGKTVAAYIVSQCRVTTSRKAQKPSVRWTVDGKRVSAKELEAIFEKQG